MPDDNSELVPPLPIPNRTVKRLCADDSAATSVKVGHRQATIPKNPRLCEVGVFYCVRSMCIPCSASEAKSSDAAFRRSTVTRRTHFSLGGEFDLEPLALRRIVRDVAVVPDIAAVTRQRKSVT